MINPKGTNLKIREHPKLGIYVDGLAEPVVNSAEAIAQFQEKGNASRQVAATNMNATSSRSHSVFTVKIEQKQEGSEVAVVAKLNLVDLAGSERAESTGATGDRLKEGANINKRYL